MADMEAAINDAGICHFLHKPWDERSLLKVVNENIPAHCNITALFPPPTIKNNVNPNRNIPSRNHSAMALLIEESIHKNNADLEQAINDNQLLLREEKYFSWQQDKNLRYLTIKWPDFSRFQHGGIINIARQSGLDQDLFTWYLLNSIQLLDSTTIDSKSMVLDMFYESILHNHSMLMLLKKLLEKHPGIILKIPFEWMRDQGMGSLLNTTYLTNNEMILNLGKRIIDITDLQSTPIRYIELDSSYSSLNNHRLTDLRLPMMNDAKNYGISTILSKDHDQSQHAYAREMEFDFF